MNNTKRIGNETELECIVYLYKLGCEILIPYGDSQKYDFVFEFKGKFYKVQCKHANSTINELNKIEYITFKTCWESGRKEKKRVHYTKDDIDFFATFYDGKCYMINVNETSSRIKTIRFNVPKNGQREGITFAENCIAEKVLELL